MLFNDPNYIFCFLPLALAGYFFLTHLNKKTVSKLWLISASLFFYAYWEISYLLLIGLSTVANFILGNIIRQKNLAALRLGITLNLMLLAYYKYADFFIDNVNSVFSTQLINLELVLPLAISFFTFQQIAYLVDCYRSNVPRYSFLDYSLFVTFFPQLIAGPIVHHSQMMPQFSNANNQRLIIKNIEKGLFIFAIGLFKKIVIADYLAGWADSGFNDVTQLNSVSAWLAALSYTFQLYFDFSGYCDMAIGAALMLNIKLPINFNSPYKAKNIQDFWRRWHITLSNWLRDYIYIPLGGNRDSSYSTYFNLFVTFLLGGLWHGAAWTFVIWGAMHGAAIAAHRMLLQLSIPIPHAVAHLTTFTFVIMAWVMFRANSLDDALTVYQQMLMLQTHDSTISLITDQHLFQGAILLAATLFCFYTPSSMQLADKLQQQDNWRTSVVPAIFTGLVLFFSIIANNKTVSSPFLYFNF